MNTKSIWIVIALSAGQASAQPQASQSWQDTPQEEFLESSIVQKFQCVTCHTITEQGGNVGPILNVVGLRRTADWLDAWLQDPNAVKPGTKMPKFPFTDEERRLAVSYLSKLKRPLRTGEILASDGTAEEKGARLFADYDCYACHRIADQGRFVGPDLTWVGLRKPQDWERIWLADPPGFKPDTFMPDFHIPEPAVESLAAFLHTQQGQGNDLGRKYEYLISFMINTSARDRGEMVWKRFGCWSCHGEGGTGGIANPNAAPGHEFVPDLKNARDTYDPEAFFEKLTRGTTVPATHPEAVPQPYRCPAFPEDAFNRQDREDLYAYISSLAPPKSRWTIR